MSILSTITKGRVDSQNEEHWISVSDLMSALMMIFLMLAVFYMIYYSDFKKTQQVEHQILSTKAGELARELAGAEKLVADKSKLLTEATSQYKALFDKAGELEAALAGAEKLLGDKERMLSETTDEYKALFNKAGDLERKLAGAEKLLAEKSRLLDDATIEFNALFDKAGDLEKKLAGAEKLLAEKSRLLEETVTTSREYKALLAQAGSIEDRLASAEKLLALKTKLLAETNVQLDILRAATKIKEVKLANVVSQAVIYEDVIKELRQSLLGEFNPDMKKWNAELRDDLTFRFNEPQVLFDVGKTNLKRKFRRILDDFFPRYLKVITSEKFKADIAEVRIEGHTSSFWGSLNPRGQQAYFNNMELSQGRSRNVLFYVTGLPAARDRIEWLKAKLTANGLSSSKMVDSEGYLLTDRESSGVENRAKSQRVEFRVRIDAESKITKIIKQGSDDKK